MASVSTAQDLNDAVARIVPSFNTLSAELRNQIYHAVFRDLRVHPRAFCGGHTNHIELGFPGAALFLVNKQIASDSKKIFYIETLFVFDTPFTLGPIPTILRSIFTYQMADIGKIQRIDCSSTEILRYIKRRKKLAKIDASDLDEVSDIKELKVRYHKELLDKDPGFIVDENEDIFVYLEGMTLNTLKFTLQLAVSIEVDFSVHLHKEDGIHSASVKISKDGRTVAIENTYKRANPEFAAAVAGIVASQYLGRPIWINWGEGMQPWMLHPNDNPGYTGFRSNEMLMWYASLFL